MIISRTITLHSLETAANPFIQKTMVLSPVPQCPGLLDKHSPETLASLQTHSGRCLVRRRETGGRGERRGKRSQEKKEGKKLTINICHQLELLTSLHIIIHTPSPPPPHTHTHTHTQPTCSRKVMSLCDNVFSQSTLFRETEFVQ